jgi:hypothetical protein
MFNGLRFRVQGPKLRVKGLRFKAQGLVLRVEVVWFIV